MGMMNPDDKIDLSAVPLGFLEAYPFPAFVLLVPVATKTRPRLVSRDTDVTIRYLDNVSPLGGPSRHPFPSNPVTWGNEQWYQLTQGRSIGDCLDMATQNRLQAWVEEEDESTPAGTSFKLDMVWPEGVALYLAKTVLPLSPPSPTHAFCVITSQPVTPSFTSNLTSPTERMASPGIRSSFAMTSPRSVEDRFAEHRGSADTQASSISASDRFSEHRQSSSTSFRSSVDVGPSASEVGSPSNQIAGSYFGSALTSRDERTRAKSRRRSPHGRSPPLPVENQTAPWWRLVEEVDWANTPMGPRSKWKDTLDPLLSVTFESRTSDCCWLGPDLRLLYNQSYSQLVDHPNAWARPAQEVWAAIWPTLEPHIRQCMSGTPVYRVDDPVFYQRYGNGTLLEHYHTWRFVPITGKDGRILGIFNQSMETTEKVLQDRRLATTRDLAEQLILARSVDQYFAFVAEVLEQNPAEAPFVMLYRVKHSDNNPASIAVDLSLEASIGVPQGHPSAKPNLNFCLPARSRSSFGPNADRMSSPTLSAISALSSGSGRICHVIADGDSWPVLKALTTRQCVIVDDCSQLIKGYPLRQWDELPFAAIVVPICSEGSMDVPDAVMIMGLNVRRPFDAEYDSWLNAVRSQLVSSLAQAKASESEAMVAEDNARMEEAKAAWFRGAAHDLRSPLALVAGPISDLLESQTITGSQRQSLTIAQRNVDRLLRLVNALMDFSRLEAGRVEGRFVPIDLGEFVTDLAALFRPAVERLGLQYTIDIEPRDQVVFVDPTLFETIISNLIGNAIKYTERGSITVQLRYTDYAELSIIDTGVGIPKAEIPLVTEWYHRATTAVHAGTQGSGLGLALAKELLHLHGGELAVDSQTVEESGGQHGSVFTARIPLSFRPQPPTTPSAPTSFGKYGKAVANEAMRWTRDDGESSSEGAGTDAGTGSAFSTKFSEAFLFEKTDTILLVEDNSDMRAYIKQIFSPYCTVVEACSGQQALEMAIKSPPNLILSDVLMPKMGGLELLGEIRKHGATRIVPMVLLSAIDGEESRVEALLMGAEDFLAKPFKPKELVARVHLHLQVGKKRLHLERLYAERETEIAVLSDYCPSGIMRADSTTGLISYANRAWREQADLIDDDANNWPQYVDDKTREMLQATWGAYLASDDKELRVTWRYLTGKTISGVFIKLNQVNSEMTGILGCTTDISHEEQRLVEAEQRRIEAEESKHQQELLIDLTSHEIRTPVSAILQCSSLVKENLMTLKDQLKCCGETGFTPSPALLDDLEEDVEALESIYQCGLVQERIAGDVLSLARIQLDMLSLYDIEVDLRKEARKVSSVFASEAKMKKIDLQLKFGETLEASKIMSIKTDPVRLGQVVTNLISNAIRFTSASDVRRITVKYDVSFIPPAEDSCALPNSIGIPADLPAAEDTPIWLFVSVTDTGPGMSPKELAVLFKRFAQGNKMIHTKYGGSGLGLFICRKITELLGGRIEVMSQLGEGSVFRFFIKTRTVAPPSALAAYVEAASLNALRSPSAPPPRSITASPSIASTPSSASALTPPPGDAAEHILIVEDNIINQTVLKRQIVKAGLTCDVANNGLEALNLIRENYRQSRRGDPKSRNRAYDVVLMDLEMPVMDGLTAIKELREAESNGSLPRNMVIALTGNARQGQIDHALQAGMDDGESSRLLLC
ncbi:hypothetical protein I316_03722 [Kwoniella heveanensis BCC8398]|uniref:Two-component system sensor protein n=1 Tax=Kwoniella heveanensis BCC8398 TaxID=1296120 RepID=A0A1B9GUG7_9TREE|nr:hypothetical protein I316_03722 [Kwoniella heveanensis BCC8398]